MKSVSNEGESASVPVGATQVEETLPYAAWVERSIWTDRMLSALESGVHGGKWYSLHDKAFSIRSLEAAFRKVKANGGAAGVDGVTISRFEQKLDEELARLSSSLLGGLYRPQAVRRVWIPKPGTREKRPLGVPTVRDRVVQTALRSALEPIFEKEFSDRSYGFRHGRGCRQALSRVWRGLTSGLGFVVDADLKRFFDTIPHAVMLKGLEWRVSDGKLLSLVRLYLEQGVMDGMDGWTPEEGTPQGSVISPLLANIALHGLDLMAESLGLELVRYADDFVILCRTSADAAGALESVRSWTDSVGLTLHPEKTRIVDYGSGQGFEFLGYLFRRGRVAPRRESVKKLRDAVRSKTRRSDGRSLSAIIADLNPTLRGWYAYFRSSGPKPFALIDALVRERLRSILGSRNGIRGSKNRLHRARWPNAYFAKAGLFSTHQAALARQSSQR